ncbi:MAG: metallophosphoesterase, partial [Nitriliruptorales bacterium]|nr:metallophosphoesterase [Nitriliruptorales bacterium]
VALGGFSISEQVGLPSEPWGELGYDSYRTRFALPPNGDPRWEGCWYRFRYGSVEFISIDNNDVNTEVPTNIGYSEGRQRAFVEQALGAAAADPNVDFIIVLMHQAAFSNGLHGNDQGVRDAWFDLFATHGVDLVIQGHDHHYERTHLMDHDQVVHASEEGTYVSDLGTMYVVAGNGGGVQRGEGLGSGADFTAAIASQQIGTLKVEVVPDTGEGTKRLILGEYSATLAGAPIEEGIVIERTRHPTAGTDEVTGAPREDATMEVTPVTGAPAGITAIGLAATAGAAAARSWVRGSTDDEVTELRARREER